MSSKRISYYSRAYFIMFNILLFTYLFSMMPTPSLALIPFLSVPFNSIKSLIYYFIFILLWSIFCVSLIPNICRSYSFISSIISISFPVNVFIFHVPIIMLVILLMKNSFIRMKLLKTRKDSYNLVGVMMIGSSLTVSRLWTRN